MKVLQLAVIFFFLWTSHSIFANYEYPIKNSLAATIIGTPEALRANQENLRLWQPDYVHMPPVRTQFDRKIAKKYRISIFPERVIPEVFWYERGGLEYSIAQQEVQAPVIFIIAGTGASYHSLTVRNLQNALYQAGFHVIAISSPTVPNFMLNASSSVIPGNLVEDSRDIHRVMQRIMKKHDDIQVSEYYLTGYSLGASHAAFVTKLDEENKTAERFQFKKVLLINPPLSLANSVDVFDKMLEDNLPGGLNRFNDYYQKIIHNVSEYYHKNEQLGLGKEFFLEMFKARPPNNKQMKAAIGFVFRVLSSGMVFTADVYNHGGYVVPENEVEKLDGSSSLTKYSKVAHRLGFHDYIEKFYLPIFRRKTGLSSQELLKQSSLESLADFLQNNPRIYVMHNLDDPILKPGGIDRLKNLFPGRITLYPSGGHLGNINYIENVNAILEYFLANKPLISPQMTGVVK